jgi:hypothetical protein
VAHPLSRLSKTLGKTRTTALLPLYQYYSSRHESSIRTATTETALSTAVCSHSAAAKQEQNARDERQRSIDQHGE